MKIGVNARVLQNVKTGIPYFIHHLKKNLPKIDKKNKYFFLRPKINSFIKAFLYDNFLVNREIEKSKLDIFYAPAQILPFFRKVGVKYIVTVHDLSYLIFPSNASRIFYIYYKYFLARSLKNADIIVADSNNTKKDVIKYYHVPENKIKVIYLGVSEIFFKSEKKKRLIKDKYFLTLTTHPQRKNTLSILETIKKNKKLLEYKIVIAGLIEKKQIDILKEKIHNLELKNNVILWGYAAEEDLVSLYQHAEFFIYPSFYEGFGLPVLEAMASRSPVISSNTSSLVEILPNQDFSFDPRNPKDMLSKMIKMTGLNQTEKKKLTTTNYNFAKNFTWLKTAKKMITLFKNIKDS